MAKKIERPDDAAYFANIKGISLGIESHFGYAGDNGEPPKKIFGSYSCFSFSLINKNMPENEKLAIANIKVSEFSHVFENMKIAYDEIKKQKFAPSVKENESNSSPAYSVRFTMGNLKGLTPAEVILSGKGRREDLEKQKSFLLPNVPKYPGNKQVIEAIDDAIRLLSEEKLKNSKENSSVSGGPSFIIHESGIRPIMRKQKNGKNFIYEILITATPGMDYPFEVKITNYYAPVITTENGQLHVKKNEAEGLFTLSIKINAEKFFDNFSEMQRQIDVFKIAYATKAVLDAEAARQENINAGKEKC